MKENDVRETPRKLFDLLNAQFAFTLDACATHDNALCDRYYTETDYCLRGNRVHPEERGGLSGDWSGGTWCNPPFSELWQWTAKAWEEHKRDVSPIVMLVPANRTDQDWWQDHVAPHYQKPCFEIVWLDHRTRFTVNGGQPILNKKGKEGSPNFSCALLIWT